MLQTKQYNYEKYNTYRHFIGNLKLYDYSPIIVALQSTSFSRCGNILLDLFIFILQFQ